MPSTDPPFAFASLDRIGLSEMLEAPWRAPKPSRLDAPLALTGAKAAKGAAALGLAASRDLLMHLPHRHEFRGEVKRIADLKSGEDASVAVVVRSIEARRAWKRRGLVLTVAQVADDTGPLEAVWFNQPWIAKQLVPGAEVILHGRHEGKGRFRVSDHQQGSAGEGEGRTVGVVPVHPAADGLGAKRIRELVTRARPLISDIVDPLGAGVIASERIANLADAVDAIHFPVEEAQFEIARRRLAFDELLALQVELGRRRLARDQGGHAPSLAGARPLTGQWRAGLPFSLTGDQEQAIRAIDDDLAGDRAMQRLLMGEVGSGKTAVALHAILRTVECGGQALLMAPTETLAIQHMRTVESLLGGRLLPVELLTGSTPAAARKATLERLQSGELGVVIGTHALLEEDVLVPGLGLCVIDEQHRFGVRQREKLARRRPDGLTPHVLHMTATPIPRTLALASYGDLDVTTLREMPAGRADVTTHIVSGEAARRRAYERIHEEVQAGNRAFVVCPLVESSDALDARAATEEYERLASGPLRGLSLGLMHGRMAPGEKDAAMRAFASGKSDVLISTTVIEVGIDVPEATVMLVENAERFGLAQLHQLRGRVGRGEQPGLCLLCGPTDARRLVAMAESRDGFELAELDLELRGEGELTGVRQSGLPTLRAARLPQDLELLERAHAVAGEMISSPGRIAELEEFGFLGSFASEPDDQWIGG